MRSLAEDIRGRSDAELARLLELRPDLARPAPADLTALAARAATLASTSRAIDHLDDDHLATLEAFVLLDGAARVGLPGVDEPVPAGLTDLLDDGGSPGTPDLADRVVRLRDAALVWRAPEGLAAGRAVGEVLGPHPAGLGPAAAELRLESLDDTTVRRLRDDAPAPARTVLDRLVTGGPVATVSEDSQAAGAARWLADHGLVQLREDPEETGRIRVTLPREAALVLRGGRLRLGATPAPDHGTPAGRSATSFAQDVGTATATAALDLVALLDEVLEHVEAAHPRVLRSGGMAVADLRALARETELDEGRLRLLLDLALEARLIADDGSDEPAWRLTTLVDGWRESSTARRWVDLAGPWLVSLRTTAPVGETVPRALSEDMVWPPIRSLRTDVIDVLAAGTPGDEVTDALRRRRPRRLPQQLEMLVGSVLTEAEVLGLTHAGRMGPAAAHLVQGRTGEAVAALEEHLPAPVEQALVQADLTAVVPGPPSPALAAVLRRSATLESRGGASIYRFSEASVRQALDSGMDGDGLLAELRSASRIPLPQGLEYLVRDVARRHGELRAGSAGAYLRSDDETHLDQLLAHRGLSHLQLRRIAPTVLVSPVSAQVLVESLREVGAAPVREGSGGVLTAGRTSRRVPPPRQAAPPAATPADLPALVASLRRGESAAQARALVVPDGPQLPAMDPVSVAGLLREAAADRTPVWVGVTDAVGDVRRVVLLPDAVEGGRVRGRVDDEPRTYSLHRITGAVLASGEPSGAA